MGASFKDFAVRVEKDKRRFVSPGNILTILAMFGAVATAYATLAADNADTKRRVSTVEERQGEARREIKDITHEIKVDVKEVKGDVQLILRKLGEMEAVRHAERRNR